MKFLLRWLIAFIIALEFSGCITIILHILLISDKLLVVLTPIYSTLFGALVITYLMKYEAN